MDELRFDGRTAVVTGAGRGLGRAYALLLASRGANVVVNDLGTELRSKDGAREPVADAVVAEIVVAGGVAVASTDSIDTPEGGEAVVQAAVDAFGSVDVVVNNAGILRDRSAHKMAADELDDVLDVHLRGAFFVTRPAYARMREQGYGRIVVTTSAAGLYGNFGQLNYAAAKMGLVGMARTWAAEGERFGIRANAIAPGARTRMTEAVLGADADALSPDLVAPVVAWLCHEGCTLSGEVLVAFAGRVAKVVIGETRGIVAPDLTIERVAAEIDAIVDPADLFVPASAEAAMQVEPAADRG
jgi:NAD(P)-dependent dehydrogenase (short-subunit alcohol dehydrogenase family)